MNFENVDLFPFSVRLTWLILSAYITIQLIFATIHELIALFGTIRRSRCTISTNFYLYLQYFQQIKRIPNKPLIKCILIYSGSIHFINNTYLNLISFFFPFIFIFSSIHFSNSYNYKSYSY